jgi:hypothetical protein
LVIARSPLRISLGGGGTDLPSYYREFGGFLIVDGLRCNPLRVAFVAVNNESLLDKSVVYIPDPAVLPHRVCYMGLFSPNNDTPEAIYSGITATKATSHGPNPPNRLRHAACKLGGVPGRASTSGR